MYIPRKGAVFDSFLTVLSPSVAIFQMINLALCHERESRLSLSLLICLLHFQPFPPQTHTPLICHQLHNQFN